MLVYKYRGGDDKVFQRDLNSIEKNYFWSSSIAQLNDPWETLIESKKFISQSKLISRLFGKGTSESVEDLHKALENFLSLKRRVGIYSLSKTYLDELLWAHYANSHQGFCVEYDLEILLDNFKRNEVFSFAVKYNKVPPAITIADISLKNNNLIYKLSGFKSKRWEYEQEHRLITDYSGKQSYNHNALKSIYFGLRMSEEHKLAMFHRLKGRGINFFQIQNIEKSYKFEVIKLQNPFGEEDEYLKTIPSIITKGKAISFKIKEKEFHNLKAKGVITIVLESMVGKSEIEWLSNKICEEIFHTAEKVFIFYYFEDQENTEIAWATSNYVNGKLEININDFIL